MKRMSIPKQLVVLFFFILLFSFSLMIILIFSRFQAVYQTETLERLEYYIDGSRDSWGKGIKVNINPDDFELASIQGKVDFMSYVVTHRDDDYLDFISNHELMNLMQSFRPGEKDSKYVNHANRNALIYAYEVERNGEFIIIVTNTTYAKRLRNHISFEVGLLFFTILTFASIVIFFWSKGFINRIHKMQEHIANLPKKNYNVSYIDDGSDEIADLALSIEKMRLEISRNETIKQEMLQNVSHDFKTPIAVIKSYAEALNDNMVGSEASDIIINQVGILKRKVEKLLQYNRLEYLEQGSTFTDVNMKEVIENVLQDYKYQTNTKIIANLDDVYFKGYRENYYTIVDNILDNARRYANSIIKITLNEDGLIFYNDGEHLEEQFLNALFKPYEKGSKGQFGLGMSIVKKTLDFFNMNLDVKNEEVGVSFIITKNYRE